MSKWVRTPHLPWSEGKTADDIVMNEWWNIDNTDLVLTEKLDGECTTMTRDKVHARSEDSKDHPSRHLIKRLHAEIGWKIPEGMEIIGENTTAVHSIYYPDMEDIFYLFAVVDYGVILSWNETQLMARMLDIPHVPVLKSGRFDLLWVKSYGMPDRSVYGPTVEGYVIRDAKRIAKEEWHRKAAKYVRPNHVQTNEHWMNKPMVRNGRG